MYRKTLIFIIIAVSIITGCSETSITGNSSSVKEPVDVTAISRGAIVSGGDPLDIKYAVNNTEVVLDRLLITVADRNGTPVFEETIEEEPLTEYLPEFYLEEELPDGIYTLRLVFYSGEEEFYVDERLFFVSDSRYTIKSITSYPPVLYPGGGGLFYADILDASEDCWLRWSLDGKTLASGMKSDGFNSIRITAPDSEGVYELSLEVFPQMPETDGAYDFESTVVKSVPLYVNTDQKAGVNEFSAEDDFYALFHFRGNRINSADPALTGIGSLTEFGTPLLAVRNGILGYSVARTSGFSADRSMLPSEEGRLLPFSLMFSIIPDSLSDTDTIPGVNPGSGRIFSSGSSDGAYGLSVDVLADGRLAANLNVGEDSFSLISELPMLTEDKYASVGLAVYPEESSLEMIWYLDGIPLTGRVFSIEAASGAFWTVPAEETGEGTTVFGGSAGFSGLLDELGIYIQPSGDGKAVDPEQFRRSMELEYGKFLIYAEGFDGEPEGLEWTGEAVDFGESRMIISPGGYADFPPIYPGYEEIVFTLALSDSSTRAVDVVFRSEGSEGEIIRQVSGDASGGELPISFSLIFSKAEVSIADEAEEPDEAGAEDEDSYAVDFGGVIYRLVNNDEKLSLEVESVLVIRKNINISKAGAENDPTEDIGPESGSLVNIGS